MVRLRGLMVAEGVGAAAIYIFSYGQNTIGNRLYCFLGLRSKMSESSGWVMEWVIPLRLL